MCDTTGNHSHAHGVRSDAEKAAGDLRAILADKLLTVTKLEAMVAVISESDFPQVGEITHGLEHVLADEKKQVARLIKMTNSLDIAQASLMEPSPAAAVAAGASHDHDHSHDHHGH